MTIKNQFPFEIFVFGESIPFYLFLIWFVLAAHTRFLLLFEKFRL